MLFARFQYFFNVLKKKMNKKGIELEMLAWWIIGIVVLIIAIFVIIILKGKGSAALGYIKDLLRFKR